MLYPLCSTGFKRQADAYSAEDLHATMLQKCQVKSPSNAENELTTPFPFNVTLKARIGLERGTVLEDYFVKRSLCFNLTNLAFGSATRRVLPLLVIGVRKLHKACLLT